MRLQFILLIASFFSLSFLFSANFDVSGTWQGVMYRKGTAMEKGTVFYADFQLTDGLITGMTREEMYDSPYFSVKKINGSVEENSFSFNQLVEVKSKKTSRIKWCRIAADLTYNPTTGYLSGDFVSTDCRRMLGTIVLYRADFKLTKEEEIDVSHIWFDHFLRDFKEGLSAPEIRKIERDNFVFEPIFFDFDKDQIRPEHFDFLNRMIHIIKGHSDLRVRVTGHTDSDGTHTYNDDLSERRAQAIINYFKQQGLSEDRLVIDFKGERSPIDTNNTREGKQNNRRVDFRFI